MSERLEGTIKVSIPDVRHELENLPEAPQIRGGSRDQFLRCFQEELARCTVEALRTTDGFVRFSDLQLPDNLIDGQYIMEFEVFDRAKPHGRAINWHGQNVSQWVYAGAIVCQEGRVSTHH